MNIKIIVIEKQLKSFYKQCISEYKKRLSRYCRVQLVLCKNSKEVQKLIQNSRYIIFIDNRGKTISSEQLADKINLFQINRISDLSILAGVNDINFNEKITISNLDLDNGLLITIIFEQLYRAYRILLNEPYHK